MEIKISKNFYSEEAVDAAIKDYASVLPISLEIGQDILCLNFECDKNEEELVADELMNYVLFKQKSIREAL